MKQQKVSSPEEYILAQPQDRQVILNKLRDIICTHLPLGFEEMILYDMITYVVPLEIYPLGYKVKPNTPLPFLSMGNQKNYIGLYHMGMYNNQKLQEWFEQAWEKENIGKLDQGKSCIRLKKFDQIPYGLIGELCEKLSLEEFVNKYEHFREGKH